MNAQDVRRIGKELSNWGKWGPEDERGTLNYITPEKLVEAARIVRVGKIFSLALPFDNTGPHRGQHRWRINPVHLMAIDGADDVAGTVDELGGFRSTDDFIFMPLQSATQWDSLAHVFYDGQLYNGYPAKLVNSRGAQKNGIDKAAVGIVSRGVLLDMARYKGLETLPRGYPISSEDLQGCAAFEKVAVGRGDVLLIRTGHMAECRKASWEGYFDRPPGINIDSIRWVHGRGIAAVASDTSKVEVEPYDTSDCRNPVHMIAIRDMGMILGEMFVLDELAVDCAADGQYDFLFAAPPIPFTAAVGSPVNPLAVK